MVNRYVVRIRLPDRPGALGQVASRIGAVGGDIVAIDIVERARGRAIDEFVLELDGDHLVELLRNEIHEVDGVHVEDVRQVEPAPRVVEE
jgi:ACT domain-containing protein